jgi:hypothetical protein
MLRHERKGAVCSLIWINVVPQLAQQFIVPNQLEMYSDEWFRANRWDEVTEANRLLFGLWLESATESGESEDRAIVLWPFGEPSTLSKEDPSVLGDS